jgi:protein TonB
MGPPPATPSNWLAERSAQDSPALLPATLLLAALLHALVIYAVRFELPEPGRGQTTTRPLEVVVLRDPAPTDEVPEDADAYAQVNREGGGLESEREAEEPVAAPPPEPPVEPIAEPVPGPLVPPLPPAVPVAETPPEALPPEEPVLTATVEPVAPEVPAPEPQPLPAPEDPAESAADPAATAAQILASRSLEIAELTARIRESTSAYDHRTRRKAVSASTREYKYAAYLEAWRRKVEQIGNLNYPEEAKKHKLYGNLILHVAVRADGSLEGVRVLRSSGFDVLDQAAVDIVKLAAPFAPFPSDIRAETDVLDITRTWQFLSSNRLGWEN